VKAQLRRGLKVLALLLPLALLAAAGWALGTTAGLRALLARTDLALGATAAGGGLRVGDARGSVLGGAELDGVELALGKARVSVARLRAELHPLPLLLGKLALVRLELDGTRVTLPAEPDPEPIVLPQRIDLPLRIAVDRFELRGLAVAAGETPLLALDTVAGRASADARGFRIEDARVAAAGLRADGSLALANAQPYPMEGALRLRLERPDLPPIAGNAQLTGRLEALRLALGLDAPLAAHATLALDDIFGAKRVSGHISAREADLTPLIGALQGWRFDADLALDGTLARPRLDGTLGARHADLPPLRAALLARRDGRVIVVERLQLSAAGNPATAEAKGRVTLDADLPFVVDLRAALPQLPQIEVALAGDLKRAAGRVRAADRAGVLDASLELEPAAARGRVRGTLSAWPLPGGIALGADSFNLAFAAGHAEFEAEGAAAHGTLRADYQVAGKADRARLSIDALELRVLDGQASAQGTLELGGAQRWRATLRLRDLDPHGLDPRFPGKVSARLELSGSPAAPVLEIAELGGELRGRRIAGRARLHHGRAPELIALGLPAFVLDALELTVGSAKLSARADPSAAALSVDAPELADLLPQARGKLALDAQRADGVISGKVAARGVQVGAARVATLDGRLQIPAAGRIEGRLEATALVAGDVALDRLVLDAAGERADLELKLEASDTGTEFTGAARGALLTDGFRGQLTRWELAPVDAARWTLARPSPLRVGRGGVALEGACVSDGSARACVDGAWHPLSPWRATLAVSDLGLAAFRSYLPRGLAYAGDIDLDARIDGDGPQLGTIRAELQLSSGSIEATVRRQSKTPATRLIEFSGGRVLLERDAQRLHASADLRLDAGGWIEAELEARGTGPFDARPLGGRIKAQVEQFALLPVLLPEVKQLSGRLDADLAVSGTVGAPRFAGVAGFHGGKASVPRLGLELSAVELTVKGDGDALDVEGSAQAGGTLGWKARLRRGADGWSADGTLKGERFRALNTPEARIVASPDLTLAYAADRLTVNGSVTVPWARIAPRSIATAVQASSDEVLIGGESDRASEGGFALDARVHIALGDDVDFEGFGLKASIEGGLTLIEKPGSLTLASGELALVDGKYEAYGQLLEIERGKLLFTGGPVADPGLDVRAQRVIERDDEDDITVGIDARGTLRRPEILLYSDPAMSSSEQLSYLVLGRSLNESTEGDQQMLGDAAESMKLSGGELLAQQIGRRIGLDEVKIEDDGDQREAQLWLGTYLSPRLFVSYGIGLFEDFYSARVRYDITTKWTIEAESGRESSADFKYTIER
jgi:translocation and assembly module TamB